MSGRNAPCACGSGKKYKHCHGALKKPPRQQKSARIDRAARLFKSGRVQEALKLALKAPASPERFRLVVTILVGRRKEGDIELAESQVKSWIRLQPNSPEPWIRQLELCLFRNRLDSAKKAYAELSKRTAISPRLLYYKALLAQLSGDLGGAHQAFRESVRLESASAQGKSTPTKQAINAIAAQRAFRVATGIFPGSSSRNYLQLLDKPDIVDLLSSSLDDWEKDIQSSGRATSTEERQLLADAWHGLGLALLGQEKAPVCFRKAIDWKVDHEQARRNELLSLNYSTEITSAEIMAKHLETGRWFQARYGAKQRAFQNVQNPNRALRVGYLSSDINEHPVIHFILPVLKNHDSETVQVFIYHNSRKADALTEQAKNIVHRYVPVKDLSDADLIERIAADRIDVLVDLNGYTGTSRIAVLAARAAPIQMTWIGYPNTTGLETVDYRIVDRVTDPPTHLGTGCSEQLLYMPHTFSVYDPLQDMPPVEPAPCLTSSSVTFGSFNNFAKLNEPLLDAWAKILERVPQARLIIKDFAMEYRPVREKVLRIFEHRGISDGRVQFKGYIKSKTELFRFYQTIDISLDSFPYNGTTTTCESLYMGVPVITCAGPDHRSRVTASQLQSIGLPELIAHNLAEYTGIAVNLASDRELLVRHRLGLRDRMENSLLMDASRFTSALESAYREAFARWCEQSAVR